jgi:Flp pilus assembly protein CpaB
MEFAETFMTSRRGTLLIGAGAALLAAVVLIVYLKHYRSSLKGANAAVSVLVAKNLIQKGAPGNIVATNDGFQVRSMSKDQIGVGAITDPGTLRGLVAAHDIYPGQQLTTADFVAVAPYALQTQLTGVSRAIAVPFDGPHGMSGQIGPGDHVDVYVYEANGGVGGSGFLKLLMQNAVVLRTEATGATPGTVVLRATGRKAAELAFAADTGKLWLVLRPASGAKPSKPGTVTIARLLLGSTPVH